jgi:glycosyltransferase involved in cell wall biosynthesis
MLAHVAVGLDRSRFQQKVMSLTGDQPIGARIVAAGISVTALHGRGGILTPGQFVRARRLVNEWEPDVIHTWMYHANLVGQLLIAGKHRGERPLLLTSVRGAINAPQAQQMRLRAIRQIDAWLSSRTDRILFNSEKSADQHFALGYDRSKSVVIPNGFDIGVFEPRLAERQRVRSDLGWNNELVVGMIGRFDPLKGHLDFLRAAAEVAGRVVDCRFVLIGRGCDDRNALLCSNIGELKLSDRVALLGERSDVPALLNSLDVLVCPSISESFPNVVGEAMATGVPCVVTDVGDCAKLVGSTGIVVPPSNVRALADAIVTFLRMSADRRAEFGGKTRARICEKFSLSLAIQRYSDEYESLMTQPHRRKS